MPEIINTSDRKSKNIGFMAKTRRGKTTTLKVVLRETGKLYPNVRFCIFDKTKQFLQFDVIGKGKNKKVLTKEGSLPYSKCRIYNDPTTFEKELKKDFLNYQYHIIWNKIDFDTYIETCYKIGGMVLVVDEIQDEIDSYHGALTKDDPLTIICRQGAHIDSLFGEISIIWTTKRPAETHKIILTNAQILYIFQTTYQPDRKKILAEVGGTKELDNYLKQMEVGDFIRFDDTAIMNKGIRNLVTESPEHKEVENKRNKIDRCRNITVGDHRKEVELFIIDGLNEPRIDQEKEENNFSFFWVFLIVLISMFGYFYLFYLVPELRYNTLFKPANFIDMKIKVAKEKWRKKNA